MDAPSITSRELLSIWERGQGQSRSRRALLLLEALCEKEMPQDLAKLPLGRRDALLLSFREQAFGSTFFALVTCPECGQKIEASFHSNEIRSEASSSPCQEQSVTMNDYSALVRLPNTLDLMAIDHISEIDRATRVLLERCIVAASFKGEDVQFDRLPESLLDAVLERMSESDPQADVRLDLSCPECGHGWQAAFDILSYLWRDIDQWAVRILHDVHVLASAYGWSEVDILSMSAWRRQVYLELVGQ
ncbi:MAG: hypothetical protein LUQ44_03485 [Methanothrix sp.]|nr:hypothetical protein [Methanothrix sp.]